MCSVMKIVFQIPTLTHDGLKALIFLWNFIISSVHSYHRIEGLFLMLTACNLLSGSESQTVDVLPCSSTGKTKQARNKAHQR